jgi:hypothetical protein
MTVALDTMTLIWGIQSAIYRSGNPRQRNLAEMQRRSVILLDLLEEEKETILVPCVAVAELLVGVDLGNHAAFLAEVQRRFFCPPFDLPASELAARLWIRHRELPKGEQIARNVLKSDVMIVATAKVAGAKKFYSSDPKCRALADLAGMTGNDLPLNHPDMFRDQEINRRLNLNE